MKSENKWKGRSPWIDGTGEVTENECKGRSLCNRSQIIESHCEQTEYRPREVIEIYPNGGHCMKMEGNSALW